MLKLQKIGATTSTCHSHHMMPFILGLPGSPEEGPATSHHVQPRYERVEMLN